MSVQIITGDCREVLRSMADQSVHCAVTQRNCIGIELNPEYAAMARTRFERDAGMFAEVA